MGIEMDTTKDIALLKALQIVVEQQLIFDVPTVQEHPHYSKGYGDALRWVMGLSARLILEHIKKEK